MKLPLSWQTRGTGRSPGPGCSVQHATEGVEPLRSVKDVPEGVVDCRPVFVEHPLDESALRTPGGGIGLVDSGPSATDFLLRRTAAYRDKLGR